MLYTRYVKNLIAGCLIVASGSIVATPFYVPSVDYPTLRDAVDAAESDDTIEITDNINGSSAGNHDVIIDGKTLTIVGNERIIDLGEVGRLFNIRNSSNVTIQNLTIQKGNSDNGGAIYNDSDSRLTVNSCAFSGNTATSNGGAIYNDGGFELTVGNCTFNSNTATTNGGAIYNVSGSTLTVSDCTFGSNRTTGSMSDGGAIYNAGTATFTLNDSRSFSNNTATGNGGAISNSGNLTITGNYTFGDNNAFYDGGAISNSGTLTITACTFNINDAISGGAISSTGSLTLTNCIFSGNSTEAYGAAISSSSTLNITGCTFSGNSAATRGGAVKSSGTLNITGCTFSSNSATNHGGVIFNDSDAGPLTITSCTFSGNSADYGGVLVNINDSATITCSCSRFVNNTATTSGSAIYNNGNIVTATNNWWGTEDSGTISSLFSGTGTVNYSPWITMSLVSTHPLIGATATITVDFASSGTTCTIPTAPITFSTTDGTVTPTESLVIDGTATASFVATNTTARVCAQVDSETECVYSGLLIVDLYGTYTNIQAAINDAQSGDTIYITAGQTFSGTGNYNITITKNLTFDRIGEGDDPVIDLDSQGRLFTINEGQTVSIHNLNIQKGRSDSGGAILNYGTATLQGCSFSFNYVTGHGGAIFCAGTATLTVTGCTFDTNEATIIGGAIYNRGIATLEDSCSFIGNRAANGGAVYSDYRLTVNGCTFKGNSANNGGVLYNIGSGSSISCSRLVNNTASSSGSAIYTTVSFTAENNWWGTNDDPGTVPNLFGGIENITYDPWITASLTRLIPEGMDTSIKITFSSGCLPDGTPVAFSTTDGTITPTLALTIDGVATTTLSGYGALQLTLTATIGPDVETYVLSNIATSIPVNPYRFNFGCICSDTGGEHILIGSHNMTSLDGNSLDCWTFNETPTVSFINSLDLGQQIIMDSATYNTEAGMNIVLLTQTQEGDTAIVLVTYDGVSTVSQSSTPLSSQAFKAQWFVSSNGTPYIVADTQDGMSLYEVDLTSYTVTLSSSVPNLGAGMPSAFLRWYPQGDSLYVIQGYNQTSIATYKVDLTTGTIEPGLPTGLSGDFTAINSCATCYGDLVIGGAGSGEEALLMRCTVLEAGDLKITQTASIPGAVYIVNYCERCCCGDNPILVGTDNGLYSLDANTLDVVASNTLMPNNVWINTCWCCDSTGDYCIAVNSAHETYVFQQVADSLTQVLQLPS